MPISINPVFPVIAAQEAAPDLVLQPGTVVDARVLKLLDDGRARIAIASLAIDVFTEVPLQPGAALQLAVSQTADGLRLAIVPSGDQAATAASAAVTDVSAIATPRPAAPAAAPVLTPVEELAVAAAAQNAATRQAGLSPLFANTAAASASLPGPLQQAAQQLLAARPVLDAGLSGGDLKSAFQNSGLFLEASLASGTGPQAGQGLPDLKAALIVFRETLGSWLDQAAPQGASAAAAQQVAAGRPAAGVIGEAAASLVPDIDVEEAYLPKALLPVAEEFSGGLIQPSGAPLQGTAARAAAVTAALNLLQEANGPVAAGVADALRRMVGGKLATDPAQGQAQRSPPVDDQATPHTNLPPPPMRGGAPTAQAVAQPSIGADATPVETVRRLVDDADGAIARQTLLQIASLPDRADAAAGRIDLGQPRWQFEIPFATPQGTAVAQFEISRDGSSKTAPAATRIWRARFSLDVEPAGPVHAMVTLSGDTTSVRMWAERAETAAQLRANAGQLGQALRQAELDPGDIVIGNGAPPPAAAPARAGHFLDRAT
ncbi:MAG: flagellar hook-length control protein FliK [Pseudomonadota bacterium]